MKRDIRPKEQTKPASIKTVRDFTTSELSQELRRRVGRKLGNYSELLPIVRGPQRSEQQREKRNKQLEIDLLRALPDLSRTTAYADDSLTPEERLSEKVWQWFSTMDPTQMENWVATWIQQHPAESVGMKNAANREEWLEKTLKKVPKGKKILDAGAGELQYKRFCKHLDYVSQDFGQYTGEGDVGLQQGTWDNSKLDIISDIGDIPVSDKSFDAIMCIEVFEHIPKPIDAIKEFSRIIKPGGQLIIAAPFSSFTHFAPYYFYNGYSRYFYEKILPENGFEIREIYLNGNFFEYVAQEIRRIDDMAARYAPNVPASTALDRLITHRLLSRLEDLSAKDTGSSEFAVHDIGVLAVKK